MTANEKREAAMKTYYAALEEADNVLAANLAKSKNDAEQAWATYQESSLAAIKSLSETNLPLLGDLCPDCSASRSALTGEMAQPIGSDARCQSECIITSCRTCLTWWQEQERQKIEQERSK